MATSTSFCASALRPLEISTWSAGPPIWAWRDSSVWMDEIRLAKVKSPASAASAARPRNCMLVKPVSKANVSITAISVALRAMNRSSKVWRAAIAAHSLVW